MTSSNALCTFLFLYWHRNILWQIKPSRLLMGIDPRPATHQDNTYTTELFCFLLFVRDRILNLRLDALTCVSVWSGWSEGYEPKRESIPGPNLRLIGNIPVLPSVADILLWQFIHSRKRILTFKKRFKHSLIICMRWSLCVISSCRSDGLIVMMLKY